MPDQDSRDRHTSDTATRDAPATMTGMAIRPAAPARPPSELEEPSPALNVSVGDLDGLRVVTVSVVDVLDGPTGRALEDVARTVADDGADRLDVDLRNLAGYSPEGVVALVRCRDLCATLPRGLHYRTGTGAGRDALLAAYDETH